MSKVSRYYNAIKYGLRNKVRIKTMRPRAYPYDKNNSDHLVNFLRKLEDDTVFVFVGLSRVKHSLGVDDPYGFVRDLLLQEFGSIIVPTFTPSVRKTQVFDVTSTESEVGAFSKIFQKTADFRTLSPLKSYAVMGQVAEGMKLLDHLNDYGPDGSYEYFVKNRISVINIGTIDVRFSCIHYAEHVSRVPYCSLIERNAIITNHEGESGEMKYTDIRHTNKYKINLKKLEKDLLKNNLLQMTRINDLVVRILPKQDYYNFFLEKCKDNPYYLVD